MKKIALIDIGTNSFELIIASKDQQGRLKIIAFDEVHVFLGRQAYKTKFIDEDAFDRAFKALEYLLDKLKNYQPDDLFVVATALLRIAENSEVFIQRVKQLFGFDVQIISGKQEAQWVQKGVVDGFTNFEGKVLVVDIGGGSVELIYSDSGSMIDFDSFEVGVTNLKNHFFLSDPPLSQEMILVYDYLDNVLSPFLAEIAADDVTIVGASGAFESFVDMLYYDDSSLKFLRNESTTSIGLHDYEMLHHRLVNSTMAEREKMKGLISARRDTIVLASLITTKIIEIIKPKAFIQSNYALKEGAALHFLER